MARHIFTSGSVLALAIGLAGPAFGQSAASPAPAASNGTADQLQDIIVTARRKAESLQEVPVAVTALTPEALQNRGVQTISNLTGSIPSLRISGNSRGGTVGSVALRGQENVNQTIANDPAVGIYLDEVYLGRSAGNLLSSLYDISGLQVLRGVQGTLFGRNNTGGALLITANQPDPKALSAALNLKYGSFDTFSAGGMLNLPITDRLAVRGSYLRERRDPLGHSLATGAPFANQHRDSYRMAARWDPTDNAVFTLSYDYSRINELGPQVAGAPYSPTVTSDAAIPAGGGFYDSNAAIATPKAYGVARGFTFRSDVDVTPDMKLKTIIGRRFVNSDNRTEPSGAPSSTGLLAALTSVGQLATQNQWTAETQLAGKIKLEPTGFLNSVDYTAGFFYFNESGTDTALFPYTSVPLTSGYTRLSIGQNTSAAGYAQVETQHFTKLFLAVGLRYTHDDRKFEEQDIRLPPYPGASASTPCGLASHLPTTAVAQCIDSGERTYSYWSWHAGARYEFSRDINLYFNVDRGQRAGGLSAAPARIQSFEPETHTNYEFGLKTSLLDRKLTANLAIFRDDMTNAQRFTTVHDNVTGTNYTSVFNVGKSRIQGLELEVAARPISGVSIGGSLSLLDPSYSVFIDPRAGATFGTNIASTLNNFQLTAKRSYSLFGDYSTPVDNVGELTFHVDYAWRSATSFDTFMMPGISQPAYGLVNGRIALKLDKSFLPVGTEVAVFGHNIGNKKYNDYILFASGYVGYMRSQNPRVLGVELNLKY